MGPDALAQNQSQADGRQPSIMWDAPAAPQRPSLVLDVTPAPAPKVTGDATVGIGVKPEIVPVTPSASEIQKAVASGGLQAIPGQGAGLKKRPASESVIANSLGLPDPNAKPNPNVDPSKLVATPGGQGAASGTPGGRQPPPGLNAQEYQNWLRAEIAAEARKRPSGGTVAKGGKVQTAEAWQGELGPNADTMARRRQLEEDLAPLLGRRAAADAALATKQAENQAQQAEAEQRAAEAQAEIGRRRTEELGAIAEQGRQLQQKIASAEVDPNRWWASRGTGEKIAVGAAIALSDIARGMIGRNRQGQNPILAGVQQAIDKDVEQQIRAIDKQRGDLNDLQKTYLQAKARYEDEGIAADIAKQAALSGLRAEMAKAAADYRGLQGQEAVYSPEDLKFMREAEDSLRTAMDPNESPIARLAADTKYKELAAKTRSFNVHERIAQLELERLELDKRAAIEAKMNGTLSKNFGFTQDRVVGGSAGADPKKIRGLYKELNDVEGDQRKLAVSEREAAAKGEKDEKAIFVNGAPVSVGKGASQPSVDRAQTRISYADDVLSIVNTVEADKKAGRYIPGDPVQGMDALSLANGLAQMAGGGVASESDKADAAAALNPRDPRHGDAMNRIRQRATAAKVNAAKSVGAKF